MNSVAEYLVQSLSPGSKNIKKNRPKKIPHTLGNEAF